MKKVLLATALATLLVGCDDSPPSQVHITQENQLPIELKGLKIYAVSTSGSMGRTIYIGYVPNKQTMSLEYSQGKTTESVIVVKDASSNKIIVGKSIIMENDSMVIVRKQ